MKQDHDAVFKALLNWSSAYHELERLGFKPICYCPKDGSSFEVIEPGSCGIHVCHYEGTWPDGSFWIHDCCDLWPSTPALFRPLSKENAFLQRNTDDASA